MINDTPQFINGEKIQGRSEHRLENINPANGKLIGYISTASTDDIEDAVNAASEAFLSWSSLKGVERGRILKKTADILRARNKELAFIEVEDTGKPIREAETVDIISGADALEYFAGVASSIEGRHIQLGNNFAIIKKIPLGVCAGIGAWNYPMQIACWKAAPALAAGNTMIFKPAELTPRNAITLAEIFMEAGMPPGVFNVLQGGAAVGKSLVEHPKIRKISLTGEVSTGQKVMRSASKNLKKISLELGGKSPLIIFDDANLKEAVQGAMLANFYTQGEVCSNGTRVYVHQNLFDEFIQKLKKETEQLIIGDPANHKTQIGSLISSDHREKVLNYIEVGKSESELLFGGVIPEFEPNSPLNNGYFVKPTAFYAKSDAIKIVKDEIFGPVMSVLSFEDEDDVIHRANDTPYGLSAGIFTNDLKRAHRVIDQLDAGMCWINTYNINPVQIPFGGIKMSGFGRENGLAAIDDYTQLKTIFIEMDGVGRPFDDD